MLRYFQRQDREKSACRARRASERVTPPPGRAASEVQRSERGQGVASHFAHNDAGEMRFDAFSVVFLQHRIVRNIECDNAGGSGCRLCHRFGCVLGHERMSAPGSARSAYEMARYQRGPHRRDLARGFSDAATTSRAVGVQSIDFVANAPSSRCPLCRSPLPNLWGA